VFKDMEKWVEIRRDVLSGEISKREACKKYGLQWRTLERVLKHEEPVGYQKTEPRKKPKLEEFLPRIHEILRQDQSAPKKQRHTAKRIFERLKGDGYEGGLTVVKEAVRAWKRRQAEVRWSREIRRSDCEPYAGSGRSCECSCDRLDAREDASILGRKWRRVCLREGGRRRGACCPTLG
jgi:hypothetical protein